MLTPKRRGEQAHDPVKYVKPFLDSMGLSLGLYILNDVQSSLLS
jgi:hypothetical protein